jgi:hypothetical protein
VLLRVLLPTAVRILVVLVEARQRPFELDGQPGLAAVFDGPAALPGQVFADADPQVAVRRRRPVHRVVRDRHARHLHDAALDRVDQGEVGDNPGEERPFRIPRAAQEEGRRGEVVDGLDADLALHRFEAADPDAGLPIALFRFPPLVTRQLLLVAVRFAAVAVMGLVVQHDDVLLAAELPADPADHLTLGFGEGRFLALLQDRFRELAGRDLFAAKKGVVVGDQDPGFAHRVPQVGRDDLQSLVVVLRVAGEQDAQPVLDRDAWRDDEERVGEPGVLRVGQLVERVPGDDHRHHRRLAAARGHLAGHAEQLGVRVGVELPQLVLDPVVAVLLRDLRDVDQRLQRLDLAEEEPPVAVGAVPVLEQAGRRAGDVGVAALAPKLHALADAVDVLVLLNPVGGPVLERLLGVLRLLPGPGDGDEVRARASLADDVVGDTAVVEPVVPARLREWGVDDRVLDNDGFRRLFDTHGPRSILRQTLIMRKASASCRTSCGVLTSYFHISVALRSHNSRLVIYGKK